MRSQAEWRYAFARYGKAKAKSMVTRGTYRALPARLSRPKARTAR